MSQRYALPSFDVPAILGLTQRIFTFSTYVFFSLTPTEGLPEYGNVAALGMIMVVFAVALSWCYRLVQRQAPRYAVVTGKAYRPRIFPLGARPSAGQLLSSPPSSSSAKCCRC